MISVIIPNYNNGKYISKAIESVVSQSYSDYEIIIIDDGSDDDSREILCDYQKRYSMIHVLFQSNQNAAIARNRGMEIAKGEYLLFLDSDDYLCENALQYLLNGYNNDEVDLVIGDFDIIDVNENVVVDRVFEKNPFIHDPKQAMDFCYYEPSPTTKLYKSSIIKKYSISWGNVRIGQDLNFYLKYLACVDKVNVIPQCIYKYRLVDTGITHKVNYNIFDIIWSLQDVEKFYVEKCPDYIENYLNPIKYINYAEQMSKCKRFKNFKDRLFIVNFFSHFFSRIDDSGKKYGREVEIIKRKTLLKITFKHLYCLLMKNK